MNYNTTLRILNGCLIVLGIILLSVPFGIWYTCQADEPDPATSIVIESQKFDTSIIENWCGEPTGTIRMVGAWAYDENTFEDETGNLWSYDNVNEQAFYLLWIDDMGTPEIEDDEILKVWQESY